MIKCLWMKAIGKHVLLSVYNFRVTPMLCKFNNGNIIVQVGWLSLYYHKGDNNIEPFGRGH